jgi:hypothetical protein
MKPLQFIPIAFILITSVVLRAADDPIDTAKLRSIHLKAQKGEKLTSEEQQYYEQGKAARRKGEVGRKQTQKGDRKKKQPTPTAEIQLETKKSTGLKPLSDMSAEDSYHGEDGGLYGKGKNSPPETHLQLALRAANRVQPLDATGKPAADGKIVLLTHGMSNTTNESERFLALANSDPRKNPKLLLVDGAQGGIDSRQWISNKPTRSGAHPWARLDQRLKAVGATASQVQVVWMKHAMARVGQFGEFPRHAKQLQTDLGEIARLLKEHFPNLQLAFISSRSYGGYATTSLNPEPYAYESAFAVRGVIQEQMNGAEKLSYEAGTSPVLLWGPYLWSDGELGRKLDDLKYLREDYREDGTHPSESGRQKVAAHLLEFFATNAASKPWFTNR